MAQHEAVRIIRGVELVGEVYGAARTTEELYACPKSTEPGAMAWWWFRAGELHALGRNRSGTRQWCLASTAYRAAEVSFRRHGKYALSTLCAELAYEAEHEMHREAVARGAAKAGDDPGRP